MAYTFLPNYNPYYQMPQTQQSNLIHVQSEAQAREWTVSLGSSVMFIDDNAPFIYTKTAGSSQLEPAVFKRFRVTEDNAPVSSQNEPQGSSEGSEDKLSAYLTKAEFEPFKAVIEKIQKELIGNEPTE